MRTRPPWPLLATTTNRAWKTIVWTKTDKYFSFIELQTAENTNLIHWKYSISTIQVQHLDSRPQHNQLRPRIAASRALRLLLQVASLLTMTFSYRSEATQFSLAAGASAQMNHKHRAFQTPVHTVISLMQQSLLTLLLKTWANK